MPKERIGIMGGSFNPIHARHIEMAVCAKREFDLERIIFLPTGNPPHKRAGLEDAEDRYEMTRLAVYGMPGFTASRMEIDREGIIYTVDTLGRMQKQMPDTAIDYIIGEDTLVDLPNWRKADKVFTMCRFLVCCRSSDLCISDPATQQDFLHRHPSKAGKGGGGSRTSAASGGVHPSDGPVRLQSSPGRCQVLCQTPANAFGQAAGAFAAGGAYRPETGAYPWRQ